MKKIIKYLIICLTTILVLIALAGIYKFNYLSNQEGYDVDGNKITKEKCLVSGGHWEKVGMLQSYGCVHKYSDRGKSCTSSADCQGDCIVTKVDGDDPHCADDNNKFGCKSTIEDFEKEGVVLCID